MSTPSDADHPTPSRQRGAAPPKKGTRIWIWASAGFAVFCLSACVLVVVAINAGFNWVDEKLEKFTAGQPVLATHPEGQGVMRVAYSPDGGRIATVASSGSIWIWNAETGESVLSIKPGKVSSHSLAFSPDGTRLAIGGQTRLASEPKTREKVGGAIVWDPTTGEKVLTLEGHTASVGDIAYSPDGTRLATASGDTTVIVWDAKTGKELLVLKGHSEGVSCVAFSPDGSRLVTGSRDGTARLWVAATGEEERKMEVKAEPPGVAKNRNEFCRIQFSSDGKQVWGIAKTGFWTWDADTGDEIRSIRGFTPWDVPDQIAFHSATKQRAIAYSNGVTVWNLTTGESAHRLRTKPSVSLALTPDRLTCVAFSPDGTRVVGGGRDGAIRVWKLNE